MTYNKDGITVVEAIKNDIYPIHDNLCHGDLIEAQACGVLPIEMLLSSFNQSLEAYTIKKDGVPISMFGLCKENFLDNKVIFWILSSEEIHTISRQLIKHSHDYIKESLDRYTELYNYIHADNAKALRWARFLGAKLTFVKNMGVGGEDFYKFSFKSPCYLRKKVMSDITEKSTFVDVMSKLIQSAPEHTLCNAKGEIELGCEYEHSFTDGMYVRKMIIPKDMILVTKVHKTKHPYFIMKGDATVVTRDHTERIKAPYSGITEVGTQRIIRTHEETLWITVHATDKTDIEKITNDITCNSVDDFVKEIAE